MFIDAKDLPSEHLIECDLCIIGAGAAGITMAREFIGTGIRVVLLESGGFRMDEKTQSLYRGKNVGIPSFNLDVNRLRYFGGTTNHWAGHCRPLAPIDFEKKAWVPHSGWPITRKDLDPYYIKAQPILGLGEYKYEDLDYFTTQTGLPTLQLDENRLKTAVYNQSPPTRFGKVYRKEIKRAQNIEAYLNANVLELETNGNATEITGLKAACINGPEFSVKAKQYVLATGGMENARLLLLSNRANPKGLGNDKDLVGRFFMDHVLLRPGLDVSYSQLGLNLELYNRKHRAAGGRMFTVLAATEKLLRREKINNFRIHLVASGAMYKLPFGGVFSDIDGFQDANPPVKARNNSIAFHLVLEPVPNPDSRITLSNDRDLFKQRKIDVNWQLSDADLNNAYRALELAALEFGRLGLGRGYGEIFKNKKVWPGNLEAGRHHCGTTRMTDSDNSGVVDKQCKLFNTENLYIAGSSVFPTIGYANPTITIVALALRLSEHLKGKLS
ncbi:GMC oxidoreductase [Pseudomonadota bacterium]